MKVCLIINFIPTSENIRGASALPYHIIAGAKESLIDSSFKDNIEFIVYSFNFNDISDEQIARVEEELGIIIKKIPLPNWYSWIFKLHLLFLRIFLKYPFINYIKLPQKYVNEIKALNPNLIWVYGEELSRIVKQFPEIQRIHIGPDTESFYYYRMLEQRFVMNNTLDYWKCALMYRKYARMESKLCSDSNYTFYAVGKEDVQHLLRLTSNINAKILTHPHYEVSAFKHISHFSEPRIKILIAGRNDLYMHQSAEELVQCFISNSSLIKDNYIFTFLGKGWEQETNALSIAGYEVNHITFAPDYIEEICKHDIQITPITIGTGTKGKVLDALANGLLVIGTQYALENIAVKNGESCIEYNNPQEVINILNDIPNNRHKYEMMAEEGRKCVLTHHNRAKVSRELFNSSDSHL